MTRVGLCRSSQRNGGVRTCARILGILTVSIAAFEFGRIISFAQELKLDHPCNQLGGSKIRRFQGSVLELEASVPTSGRVVLFSRQPLLVKSSKGAGASLRPGWDGTLGYGLYGLEFSMPELGLASIVIEPVTAPRAPLTASRAETASFVKDLQSRQSRFPELKGEFLKWQETYRAQLVSRLMNGRIPQTVPLQAKVLNEQQFGSFALRSIEYQSTADRRNSAVLAIPSNTRPAPLLLALHGHEGRWGKADPDAFRPGHVDDFCAYFAERGWAVIQPATMNHTLQNKTWTLQGEWTWDAMVSLDYALTLPEIDAERVAVCGLSTGGHLAMNVLALDDRVKAGVAASILSSWHHLRTRVRIPPHCDCGVTAQLGPLFEQSDWAALAVPKPVQFQHGKQDAALAPGANESLLKLDWNTGVMPNEEYEALFAELDRAYRLWGRPANTMTHFHAGGHQVDNESAFRWLNRHVGKARER